MCPVSIRKAWEQLTPQLCGYIALSCSFALALNFLGTFALHDLGASAQQIVGKLNTICLASISVAFLGEHLPVMVVLGSALVPWQKAYPKHPRGFNMFQPQSFLLRLGYQVLGGVAIFERGQHQVIEDSV